MPVAKVGGGKHKSFEAEAVANWLKCMEKGSVKNIGKLNRGGNYTISQTGEIGSIHPESLVFYMKPRPALIVFNQVVKTSKVYLRDVTVLAK